MTEGRPVGQRLAGLGKPINLRVIALGLDNFKSFRKKTRIPLRDGFSTISGPNGSGKSNIIDALQFVLGTATSRGMRAERLTDLICNQGGKNSARVWIEMEGTFPRADGSLVNRQIEVARVVRRTRSGTNAHYELDGETIRLTDLHDVLRTLGFPTSGQNVVMQGDVIQLATMGPVKRRQVLDELAGTKEFDRRIGEAHGELEASDRCTEDTKLILKELASRLGQLKKERDQALAFQTLTSRKASLEEDLTVLEVTEAEVKVGAKAQEIESGQKAERALGKRRETLGQTLNEKQAELKAVEEELASKGEGERMQAVRAVETLKVKIEGQRARDKELAATREARQAALPGLEQQLGKHGALLEELDEKAEALGAQIQTKEDAHQVLAGRMEQASEALSSQSAAQLDAAQQSRKLREEQERKRGRERSLTERDRALAESISRLAAEEQHLSATHSEVSERLGELREQSQAAATVYREQREAAAEAGERRRNLLSNLNAVRAGLETASAKMQKAEREVAVAEERRTQALLMSGGKALAFLRTKHLDGLHGPVSDLVRFDTDMALAIEAAAGGRLNWVVTDDEHVAKRGIELLRQNRVGRLSFAPLTKTQGPRLEQNAPRGNAILGFALDLVEYDRRYEQVMRSVFGNTLVVQTLQDALPLIGRFRMVTLEGDILERHGIMSGGAASRSSRSLLAAAPAGEELEQKKQAFYELERQQSAARGALREAEQAYENGTAEFQTLTAKLAAAEAKSAALNAELGRLEAQGGNPAKRLSALAEELAAQRAEAEAVGSELRELRQALEAESTQLDSLDDQDASSAFEALTREAKQLEIEMRALETELSALRAQHAEVRAERRAIEERLAAAQQALDQARREVGELAQERERLALELQTLTQELGEREGELKALSGELMALAQRRDDAREAAQTARDAVTQADHELRTLRESLEGLAVELTELTERAQALRAAAEEREIEVPGPEEAPPDLGKERRRLEETLGKIVRELDSMGPVNQLAIEQFEEAESRHEELETKINRLEEEKTQIRQRIVALEGKKKVAFLHAFALVSEAFSRTFAELARGEGRLRLEDPKDPFAGGLIIEARPRGKKLSKLEIMSGGEKTLTSLAFIFALQEVNPAPFFVFDEVDAALDGVNTDVLSEAIARRGSDRQYLVISHHRVMLDKSCQTIGVTMRKGFGTQVTGVTMDEAEAEDEVFAEAGAGQ
ncbi:MAG: chromosome segregation protein SMC [Planctomycetota bacterium]